MTGDHDAEKTGLSIQGI